MKICILIPIHNEGEHIGKIVEGLRNKGYDVIVVDDGSTDNSGKVAREKGAHVLSHEKRMGKGKSLRDGFDYAVQSRYEGVITLDGDGQHHIDDIDQFTNKVKISRSSFIVGDRMHDPKGMPLIRFLVNRIMSFIVSLVCHQKIPDSQCGFRFIKTEVLKSIHLSSSDYEIESELLIQACKNGFKVDAVPVRTIYSNEISKINPVTDTIRFLKYIGKELRKSHGKNANVSK
jgi:glycosyltransferase involved in cell wall biosynthesis